MHFLMSSAFRNNNNSVTFPELFDILFTMVNEPRRSKLRVSKKSPLPRWEGMKGRVQECLNKHPHPTLPPQGGGALVVAQPIKDEVTS